ncbi:GNAT family N-acetyltransferase [Okeania sp. SIO3I5]|uniref:GNAT family N-acetyltransferase n=1 Tax=Okeania sp. SIO3I5 TaxID=2607805 RepID=UPI0025EA0308|nr:GNAT family N-acetyltransferase [Okeania sp. SIO3I5]
MRQFKSQDLDELYGLYSNPKVMKYVGKGILTKAETKTRILKIIESWKKNNFGMWSVVHKIDNKMIGCCGLCFLDNTLEIELGYLLNPAYWHQGLATEVAKTSLRYGFEEFKLKEIVGIAQPENIASQKVMEKLAIKYEKDANYYQINMVYYKIFRKEYHPDSSLYVLHRKSV